MLEKAVLLFLVLHVCVSAYPQTSCTSSLSGRVTDEHGHPLPGATIMLRPGDAGQTTDSEGRYNVNGLCPGSYRVTVHFIGYKPTTLTLRINGAETKDVILEEEITELDEVVIQHHDAANTEFATTYTQLDERKLAESAGKSLGETLREIPGVTSLQTGPGIFKPVVHGVHSQRLLILNHAIRQEGQQWGAEHAPEIDPFIAANIVVIKDASAIKYGADALGGVIVVNPAPLPETNKIGGTLASVVQSNGRSGTLSGMIEGGLGSHDGWGWRLQGTIKKTGDYHTPEYILSNSGVRELNFSAATGYHTKKLGLDIFFSRFQSELGVLRGTAIGNLDDLVNAMERDVPLYTSDFSYKIREPRQEVSHNLLKVNGHILSDGGEWRFQYGFQNNNRKEFDLRIGDLSNLPAIDLRLNSHTIDTEWETHHSENRTFSIGANAMYQTNRNIPGTQRIPFIPNFDNVSAGLFVTAKFFLDPWTIQAGARYDYKDYSVKGFDFKNTRYDASLDFNNVAASVGVTRHITSQQSLNLNVSTAWRPPHVSELYSVGTHQSAAAIEFGLMLDPETNEVRDIRAAKASPEKAVKTVASYQIRKSAWQLTASPYVNYIRNYIYLRPEGITKSIRGVYPYFRYHQTDALFLGVDVDASIKLPHHLTAKPAVSLLKARDVVNDSYFVYIPSNRYALDLRYEQPNIAGLSNTYVEWGIQHTARQSFAPRVVSPREIKEADEQQVDPFAADQSIFDFAKAPDGYFLVNIATGFSVSSEKVQYDFRLSADNVFNQRYREYTNRFRYYADDLGRNVTFTVKCIF